MEEKKCRKTNLIRKKIRHEILNDAKIQKKKKKPSVYIIIIIFLEQQNYEELNKTVVDD